MQGEGLHLGQAPPEARAGKAERGRGGVDPHLVRGDVAGDHRADPVAEGVAGREDAYAPSRPGAELLGEDRERAWPFQALASVRRDHREVAGAADEGLGRLDRVAGGRAEAVEAVLADPDDGEPRAPHATHRPRSR